MVYLYSFKLVAPTLSSFLAQNYFKFPWNPSELLFWLFNSSKLIWYNIPYEMKVTAFIAAAILAHCAAAAPVYPSSPLSSDGAHKNQTNSTISAHHDSRPIIHLIPTDFNDAKVRNLFEELPTEYRSFGGENHSKRQNVQNESSFKPQ